MSPRCERWLACCFLLAGVCLLAWIVAFYLAPSPGSGLEIAQTDIEVSDCIAGEKRDVVLRLQNHSGRPIHVLGLSLC